MEAVRVVGGKPHQRGRRGRRDRVENPQQRIGIALAVARNQLGVVEVVAGIHAHAGRQPAPHRNLALLVQQRDLYAVDLAGIGRDDRDRGIGGGVEIGRAPIARKLRIEHVAEPMDDHRLAHLREDAAIDPGIVVGRATDARERARGHQHDAPADRLDGGDLLFVGMQHVVESPRGLGCKLVGADAREHQRAARPRGRDRTADEFERGRPIEPHAALRGIHRFGDAEAEVPDVLAERDRALPVDGCSEPGVDVGQRIGDHVHRREGDAVEPGLGPLREIARCGQLERVQRAVGARQADRQFRRCRFRGGRS